MRLLLSAMSVKGTLGWRAIPLWEGFTIQKSVEYTDLNKISVGYTDFGCTDNHCMPKAFTPVH
jgi:hypothetical protein